jgi:hypothetical protein
MKTRNISGLMAVGAIFLAANANALPETETFTEPYSGLTAQHPSETLVLDYFNPHLGTLDGVTVTLTSVDSISAFTVNVSGLLGNPVNIAYSAVSATAHVTVNSLVPLLSATSQGTVSYGAGISVPGLDMLPGAATSPESASYSPLPAGLSAFEGPSTFDVTVTHGAISASGSSTDRNSDLLAYGGTFTSAGMVSITYDYTVPNIVRVPDGGLTAGLLGCVLLGMGALQRKLRA